MSGPSIHLTYPEPSLFRFPPDNLPPSLPPPSDERTWKSPFPINYDLYNGALDAKVPLTIATTYVISVMLLNAYNRRRGNKPWAISQTRFFKVSVICHNLLLAVYSGITFYAMLRAIRATWPGFDHSNGLAGVADSLCKVHGPRGLGDAAFYNATSSVWETKNSIIKLLPEGTPDPTDVGRLWNEGLAFWGWFFYLSKFYEVVDTAIIIAKGKRSATLQTYHHAGAMLCMWAGIRYMSPPIWMFVFLNSFIHTLMYTYYTLSAIGVRVPGALKRTLTTMQIAQFLFGATYAAVHLFVKYDIPISTAYSIFHPISSAVAQATSTASSVVSVASPTESIGAIIRRILLRAAGDEGVAENVRDAEGNIIMEQAKEAIQRYHEETRYRTDYHTIDCIDTTGASFAIWLNLLYLAPLTALFIRFFIRAYLFRKDSPKSRTKSHSAGRASIEAAKGVNRELDDFGKAIEKKINNGADSIDAEIKRDMEAMKQGKLTPRNNRPVSDRVHSFERKFTPTKKEVQKMKQDLAEKVNQAKNSMGRKQVGNDEAADSIDELKERIKEAEQAGRNDDGDDEAADSIDDLKERVKKENGDSKEHVKKENGDSKEHVKKENGDSKEHVKKENDDSQELVKDSSADAPETPSKKKKRKNKNNKKKQQGKTGDEAADEHSDGADSGSEHGDMEPESGPALLREELKHQGDGKAVKEEDAEAGVA